MSSPYKVVIPARYASTRLPGKPLRELLDKPMLQHVFEAASECGAEEIVIATDDERIETAAKGFGAEVCMTSSDHASGTDRLAEVVDRKGWSDEQIVVNVQGDEPLMPPALIDQVAKHRWCHKRVIVQDENIVDPVSHGMADTYIVAFSVAEIISRFQNLDARITGLDPGHRIIGRTIIHN